jgi:hypothetical protein
MKFVKYIFIPFLSLFVIGIATAYLLLNIYKDDITGYVVSELNKKINVKVNVSKVELSLLNHFPDVSVVFHDLIVYSAEDFNKNDFREINTDTLLESKKVFLSFNIFDLLNKKYVLEKITIEDGSLNILIDNKGDSNYNFWTQESSGTSSNFNIKLNRFELTNVDIVFRNKIKRLVLKAKADEATLKGDFQSQKYSLNLNWTGILRLVEINQVAYIKNQPFKSGIGLSVNNNLYVLKEGSIHFSGLKFLLNGSAEINSGIPYLDMQLEGENISIETLLSLWPQRIKTGLENITSSGVFYFKSNIKGILSKFEDPRIDVTFGIENGQVVNGESTLTIKNIRAVGTYSNGEKHKLEGSELILQNLFFTIGNSKMEGMISLKNFAEPVINLAVDVDVNLDELQTFLKLDTIDVLKGNLISKVKYVGRYSSLSQITRADINNSLLEGSVVLKNTTIKLKNSETNVSDIEAEAVFKNNILNVSSLNLLTKGNRISLSVEIVNVLEYVLLKEGFLYIKGSANTDIFNLSDFITEGSSDDRSLMPDNVALLLDISTKSFLFEDFLAQNLTGNISLIQNKLSCEKIIFEAYDGIAKGNFDLEYKNDGSVVLNSKANIEQVNIQQLFKSFRNFGQEFMQHKHLKGNVTSDLNFSSAWDNQGNVISESILAEGTVLIRNGELIDFEPIQKLSSFVALDELRHIRFSTLKNDIIIKNKTISIPQMDINSSAFNLTISGNHSFDNRFEYSIRVLLSDLLSAKAKKAKKENAEFGKIEDDGLGKTSIYLICSGTTEDYKITYDSKQARKKIQEDLKKEQQTIKQLLKEEFGLFKKDSSLQKIEEVKKQPAFMIQWEEDEQFQGKRNEINDDDD